MDREHPDSRGKHGGRRDPPGGRPRGSKNALPLGAVKAIKAAGLRVPEKSAPEHRELADEALGRIVDVMRGEVHYTEAGAVLKAATHLRSEICGPVPQKLEHTGKDGEPLSITINLGETK